MNNQADSRKEVFFNMSLDMLCIANTEGYFEEVNPAFSKTLGYTKEELLGQPFFNFIHPEDHDSTAKEVEKLSQGINTLRFENRFRSRSGVYKWFSWTSSVDPETGTLYAIARDITKQKLNEEKLEMLSLVVRKTDNAIIITEKTGKIVYVNDGFSRLTGYSFEEILDLNPMDFLHGPDTNSETVSFILDNLSKKKGFHTEIIHYHKDGTPIWVRLSVTPILNEKNEVEKYITIETDITKRKKADLQLYESLKALEKANQELDHFASMVSHDLKSPLRGIKNLADWITEDLDASADEEIINKLQLLGRRVQRMNDLVDGILQYSRIGKDKIELENIDSSKVIQEIFNSTKGSQNFTLKMIPLMPFFFGKRVLFIQVVSNLISNAIKYHDKDSGVITVEAKELGELYSFSIQDDGPGIDPRFHNRIFDIFQTLETKDVTESTGIGLSIVRKTIEEEGGTITVESSPGKGANFIFTFPRESSFE